MLGNFWNFLEGALEYCTLLCESEITKSISTVGVVDCVLDNSFD